MIDFLSTLPRLLEEHSVSQNYIYLEGVHILAPLPRNLGRLCDDPRAIVLDMQWHDERGQPA